MQKHRGLARLYRIAAISEELVKITHFSLEECKTLINLHERLESNGPLDRLRMREVLHTVFEITDDIMLDFVFKAFDRDGDNCVNETEFVKGLSIILRGTTDELCDWCYFIYDMNGDGGLAREELSFCLKGCIVPGYGLEHDDAEEGEKEIVEIAMRKLDTDRDGQITFYDFKQAVKMDPTMLVAVGPCLPPSRSCATFLALITENFRSYSGPLGRPNKPHSHTKINLHHSKTQISTASHTELPDNGSGPIASPTSITPDKKIGRKLKTRPSSKPLLVAQAKRKKEHNRRPKK